MDGQPVRFASELYDWLIDLLTLLESRWSTVSGRLYFLSPTKEEVNAIAGVCLSVCLSVSKITQKRVDGFG